MSDRVLIVMDDVFELCVMGAALKLHGIDVIGEARKGSSAISLLRSMQPNVILIDMHSLDETSVVIAASMRKENPIIGIVILVTSADLRLMGEINSDVPLGTKLVLKKSMNNVTLLCDVISGSRDQGCESPVAWINGNMSMNEKAIHGLLINLTDVQMQTLRMVVNGFTNAEISRARFVSEKAVEQIVSRIAQILQIHPDTKRNMRVQLVGEYFGWLGAPK